MLGALAVHLAPQRWRRPLQTLAILAVFVQVRLLLWRSPLRSWGLLAAPLAAAAAARWLPVDRLAWRRGLLLGTVAATAALLAPGWAHREYLLSAVLQFAVLVDVLGRTGAPRRLPDCLRVMCATNNAPVTPVPPEDALRSAWGTGPILKGAAWAGMALVLLGLAVPLRGHPFLHPWATLAEGDVGLSAVQALAYWARQIAAVAGVMFLDAGVLWMLGVPVRAPVVAPWLATDFVAYWRRANVYRYKMLAEAYYRTLLPARGPWMPVGVVAVFFLSGLQHAVLSGRRPAFSFLRWGLDGLVTAATAAWRQASQRRRIRDFIAGRPRPAAPRWRRVGGAVLAAAAVIVAHGYLMALSRPDRATRALFGFLP